MLTCVCIGMYAHEHRCLWRLEGVRSSGARVIGGCEAVYKSSEYHESLNHRAIPSVFHICLLNSQHGT